MWMRMWKTAVVLSVLGWGLAQPAEANIIGSDHQNFNPANSSKDLITVFRPETLGQGRLSLGLHFNYGVNTLPYFEDGEVVSREDQDRTYNDAISAMDVTMALGLLDDWDLGLTLPYIVHQSIVSRDGFYGEFAKMGNTEIRVNSKYRFLDSQFMSMAVVGTANYNRVKNNPYTGYEQWPAYSLEMLTEFDLQVLRLDVNVGYRWRNSGEAVAFDGDTPIEPFRDQIIASGGVSIPLVAAPLEIIGEVYSSYTRKTISRMSSRNASIIEGITGLRYRFPEDLVFSAGFGTEMRHAVSSADQRYFASLTWDIGLPEPKPAEPEPVVEDAVVLASSGQENYGSDLSAGREPDEIIVIEDILFDFNSAVIRGEPAQATLDKLASVFQGARQIELVVIAGHACAIGTEVYNLDLSERRSEAIVDWLVNRYRVQREKVVPVGFGEQDPAMANSNETGRRRNRRVEFEIYYANSPFLQSDNYFE
jgi:outer membrane protein OmpA-like peptidoglycan-associated protein